MFACLIISWWTSSLTMTFLDSTNFLHLGAHIFFPNWWCFPLLFHWIGFPQPFCFSIASDHNTNFIFGCLTVSHRSQVLLILCKFPFYIFLVTAIFKALSSGLDICSAASTLQLRVFTAFFIWFIWSLFLIFLIGSFLIPSLNFSFMLFTDFLN